ARRAARLRGDPAVTVHPAQTDAGSTDLPADTDLPPGVPIDDPVDREWEAGLEPAAVRRDREAAEERAATPRGARPNRGARPTGTRSRSIATAAAAWRQLTSMRTALLLLQLLAVAAVPGSLLPQRPVNPLSVQQYISDHPKLGPFLDRLSGYNVFSSPRF